MDSQNTRRFYGMILFWCSAVTGAPAPAATNLICGNSFQLRTIYQQSDDAKSVADPLAALGHLNQLVSGLETAGQSNSNATLDSARADLSATAAGLDEGRDGALGATLFRSLSVVMPQIDLVARMFGCAQLETPVRGTASPEQRMSVGFWSNVTSASAATISYSLLLILGVVPSLIAAFRLNGRWRSAGTSCRTSTLIVYGKQCTVTHIVEISRKGMKVEAAHKEADDTWLDLYFCGHSVQGRIVWRNAYFAGIRFRHQVSQQAVNDVLNKSLEPLGDSGLGDKATPCFYTGCHVDCPRHVPTALEDEKRAS